VNSRDKNKQKYIESGSIPTLTIRKENHDINQIGIVGSKKPKTNFQP